MTTKVVLILGMWIVLFGCAKEPLQVQQEQKMRVNGHWVTESNGQSMFNPQTSALVKWRGGLLTLSDRSADPSQRLKLRKIQTQNSILTGPDMAMVLSAQLQTSCFAEYVSNNPDLEALAVDPDDDKVFYIVTEDGSYAAPMPQACQQQYANSGSTSYPSLLIRLELQTDNTVAMTHVRPIQFDESMQIGDFPNDGIEALAFGQRRTLYLGLEKDSNKQARVFSLQMDSDFWQSTDFAMVTESVAKLPTFDSGNHPINGMDYYQSEDNREFLLLAARNDESLWVVDLSGKKEARIIGFNFFAEIKQNTPECESYELMKNASIEGVAVVDDTLWLINDPWKAVYTTNIQCPQNEQNYRGYSPLLFKLPISQEWFQ
jgi:hypothetical protein